MTVGEHDIPAAAKELARSGQLIDAVKVTREQTGLSLQDARNAVDAYIRDPQRCGTLAAFLVIGIEQENQL